MTPLRWTEFADDDIEAIYNFIANDNPERAAAMVETLPSATEQLRDYATLGGPGRDEGTRELIVNPYVVVYTIEPDRRAIRIEAILRGATRH